MAEFKLRCSECGDEMTKAEADRYLMGNRVSLPFCYQCNQIRYADLIRDRKRQNNDDYCDEIEDQKRCRL